MDSHSQNHWKNEITGRTLCTYPACVQARKSQQWITGLSWLAFTSWFISISMAVWINMREPEVRELKIENIRLQGQVLYLQGRLSMEGVIDEIARAQEEEAARRSSVVYALPAGTTKSRK